MHFLLQVNARMYGNNSIIVYSELLTLGKTGT